MHGKKHGAAFYAFHRIQLDNRQGGVVFHEGLVILIGTSGPALFIHLSFDRFLFAGAETHGARHIGIAGVKQVVIDIDVCGSLAAGNALGVMRHDMMQ